MKFLTSCTARGGPHSPRRNIVFWCGSAPATATGRRLKSERSAQCSVVTGNRSSHPEGLFMKARSRPASKKPSRAELKPGQCLCDFCNGKCCRYFSLPIDTPHTWDEFDSIRWYLAHGQTLVYVVKQQWYLLVKTRCQYLSGTFSPWPLSLVDRAD